MKQVVMGLVAAVLALWGGGAQRVGAVGAGGAEVGERRTWVVDGVEREGLVFAPAGAKARATPVVFGFHGHGGTMRNASRAWGVQKVWPEAIVVYLQGLPTKGMTDPQGVKDGWQQGPGDAGDRDVKLFDAALASMKKEFKVDDQRVYVMGHSNGAVFSYVLMAARGEKIAAIAAVAGVAGRAAAGLKPMPVFHVAGKADQIVPFRAQQRMIERVKAVDGCDGPGKKWAEGCEIFASKTGTPVVTWIHDGDHHFPAGATELIVKFFKEQGAGKK